MSILAKNLLYSQIGYNVNVQGASPLVLKNSLGKNLRYLLIFGASGGVGDPDGAGKYKIPITVRGKSLYDFSAENLTYATITPTNSRYGFVISGLQAGQPYTISVQYNGVPAYLYFRINDAEGNLVGNTQFTTNEIKTNKHTFTLNEGDTAIFYFASTQGLSLSASIAELEKMDYIQLEKGTVATEYGEYHPPIEITETIPAPIGEGSYVYVGSVVPTYRGTTVIEVGTAVAPSSIIADYKSSQEE